MLSWALSSAIGAIGGSLVAGINANVNLGTMFGVFLLASAAATLGGLDSPVGAVVGGLSLGVIESLVTNYPKSWWGSTYIGADTAIAAAFVIILVVLLVRPAGLFGSTAVERV
jgi:branched-chain amino acid transport system permease protein